MEIRARWSRLERGLGAALRSNSAHKTEGILDVCFHDQCSFKPHMETQERGGGTQNVDA